jgi:Zn-finger domain-containing protein
MGMIITAATILWATLNAAGGSSEGYAYNTEMEGDRVAAQYVYKQSECGKYLSQHLKYNFEYDEQQRLVKKEVLKWDAAAEKWRKSYCLHYVYDMLGYSVEYALWNDSEKDYSQVLAKQTYDEIEDGALRVALYNWDSDNGEWEMKEHTLMMISSEDLLAKNELNL